VNFIFVVLVIRNCDSTKISTSEYCHGQNLIRVANRLHVKSPKPITRIIEIDPVYYRQGRISYRMRNTSHTSLAFRGVFPTYIREYAWQQHRHHIGEVNAPEQGQLLASIVQVEMPAIKGRKSQAMSHLHREWSVAQICMTMRAHSEGYAHKHPRASTVLDSRLDRAFRFLSRAAAPVALQSCQSLPSACQIC
jgi:hypothetical protein